MSIQHEVQLLPLHGTTVFAAPKLSTAVANHLDNCSFRRFGSSVYQLPACDAHLMHDKLVASLFMLSRGNQCSCDPLRKLLL